jgi:peroxiredoxin
LRQDYAEFTARGAVLIAIGPDGPNAFRRYWSENDIPFPGCPDIRSKVADRFYQEVNLFKLGRMPAIFVIDRAGQVRYSHYGDSMSDIPANQTILDVLDQIRQEESPLAAAI